MVWGLVEAARFHKRPAMLMGLLLTMIGLLSWTVVHEFVRSAHHHERASLVRALMLALAAPSIAVEPAIAAGSASREDWRKAARQVAQEDVQHSACGASHSPRDYELAKQLAATDNMKLDGYVLFAATYLHNVAAFPAFRKPDMDHQNQAPRIVDSSLKNAGLPTAKLEAIRGPIRTHIFPRDPIGAEAIYLHVVYPLAWTGTSGVARVLGVVDPRGGGTNGPGASEWPHQNFTEVPARIVSRAGKALAVERVRQLKEFLHALRAQYSNFR